MHELAEIKSKVVHAFCSINQKKVLGQMFGSCHMIRKTNTIYVVIDSTNFSTFFFNRTITKKQRSIMHIYNIYLQRINTNINI